MIERKYGTERTKGFRVSYRTENTGRGGVHGTLIVLEREAANPEKSLIVNANLLVVYVLGLLLYMRDN